MKRLHSGVVLATFLAGTLAGAQVWVKTITPGVTYRMEVDEATPRIIHSLRINLSGPSIRMRTEVAGGRVFSPLPDKGREPITTMMARKGALAGLNADFFPWAGDPLGAMVSEGQIVSAPDPRRAVFGWGPGGARVGKLSWSGTLESLEAGSLPLRGLNEETPENGISVFTDAAAAATAKAPGVLVVAEPVRPVGFTPNLDAEFAIRKIVSDQETLAIEPGEIVIGARGTAVESLKPLGVGSPIRLKWTTAGFDWKKIDHVVSGGPYLLRGGKVLIDAEESGFGKSFAESRHPRTAMGITRSGDVIWLATDGRQEFSKGATLAELAGLMAAQGCVDAVNLDGGGSTTMAMRTLVMNKPSDGRERPVANGVLLFGAPVKPDPTAATWRVNAPMNLASGTTADLSLVTKNGLMVPPREILWSATGPGWIDPEGRLRALYGGKITVHAYARGSIFTVEIISEGPPPPAPTIPPAAKTPPF